MTGKLVRIEDVEEALEPLFQRRPCRDWEAALEVIRSLPPSPVEGEGFCTKCGAPRSVMTKCKAARAALSPQSPTGETE